ncbi:MAG: NmrA/HSCARG family protein [Acidobacteria bacterium]|nr:NmrA/HSCARG family protein [Acidobacteriota bacterium]
MSGKKIIAVAGATGSQGGGLVRAILNDPAGEFAARALTRDVNSEAAQKLAALGAEVVAADVDDEASLARAFDGVHGAFCVTFYWNHMSPDRERAQATASARAAKAAGVRHAIWSTLEDTRKFMSLDDPRMPTLMGKYKVPHFDVKGEADQLFADSGVPATFLLTSFYYDNFITFGMGPQRGPDGRLAITFPLGDVRMPVIAAEDIGACAYGVFRRGDALAGQRVGIAGDHLSGAEMAAAFTRLVGEEVAYNAIPPEVYRSFGFPGADDLGNMFQFKRDFNGAYRAVRDIEFARGLNAGLLSFETWLERNIARIPIPAKAAGV